MTCIVIIIQQIKQKCGRTKIKNLPQNRLRRTVEPLLFVLGAARRSRRRRRRRWAHEAPLRPRAHRQRGRSRNARVLAAAAAARNRSGRQQHYWGGRRLTGRLVERLALQFARQLPDGRAAGGACAAEPHVRLTGRRQRVCPAAVALPVGRRRRRRDNRFRLRFRGVRGHGYGWRCCCGAAVVLRFEGRRFDGDRRRGPIDARRSGRVVRTAGAIGALGGRHRIGAGRLVTAGDALHLGGGMVRLSFVRRVSAV